MGMVRRVVLECGILGHIDCVIQWWISCSVEHFTHMAFVYAVLFVLLRKIWFSSWCALVAGSAICAESSPYSNATIQLKSMVEWVKQYNAAIKSLPRSILPFLFPIELCKDVCDIIRQYHDRSAFDVLHERLVGIERYEYEMSLHGYDYFTERAHYFSEWCDISFVRTPLYLFYGLERNIALTFQHFIPTLHEARRWQPVLLMFWTSSVQMDLPLEPIAVYGTCELELLKRKDMEGLNVTSHLRQWLATRIRFRQDEDYLSVVY